MANPDSMKAWQLDGLGGPLTFNDVPVPDPRPGSVVVRIEASALLSYQKAYIEGRLPHYNPPKGRFTLGTSGVGVVHAIGRDVWHLVPGQRVLISPHLVTDERVADPAQILIGLTGYGAIAEAMQADWRDGTLAEYAVVPRAQLTPIEDLATATPAELAVIQRFLVPLGGLQRGRLTAGETVIVTGATGAFGTAAVLLAVALGAGRVVAAGRKAAALDAVVCAAGARVVPVVLTGDATADTGALREAAGGGAELAFDIVGRATDPEATLAALRALRRGGRLVLMGSMTAPLPLTYGDVMMNNWEIIGQFMYPADASRRLLDLVRAGLLDVAAIRPQRFPLAELPAALAAAESAGNLACVVAEP